MATHDYIISNASGASVRADLNNALAAIVSNNSNATSPATTYAYQWWADTTTGQLKLRNSANSAWITIFELDGTMLMEDGTESAPGLAFASDLNTGFFRPSADHLYISTGGANRVAIKTSEVVINEPSNDVDFRVESNSNAHMLFVDAGNDVVGIGTSTPSSFNAVADDLVVSSSGDTGITINAGTSSSANVFFADSDGNSRGQIRYFHSSDSLSFSAGGSDAMRIDSSQRLLVGHSSSRSVDAQMVVQIEGTTQQGSSMSLVRNSNDAAPPNIVFGKSRGTTTGSNTVVQAGDDLGIIQFFGADGTDANSGAAFIKAEVDGTPGSNDMPGRLVLATTADGASSPTERLRIDSSGNVGIGESTPDTTLHIDSLGSTTTLKISSNTESSIDFEDKGGSAKRYKIGTNITSNDGQLEFKDLTANVERMRIDSSGRLVVGTSTALDTTAGSISTFHSTSGGRLALGAGTVGAESSLGEVFGHWNGNKVAGMIAVAGSDTTNRDDGELRFYTSSSGPTVTERLRIQSDGTIQLRNSPGIDFSQIQTNDSGMTSETLDSYEEGTWTVTLNPSSGFTPTSNTSTGYYTKIGRLVTVIGNAIMTIPSSLGSYTNNNTAFGLAVTGLPFTSINASSQGRSAPVIGVTDSIDTSGGTLAGHGAANSTQFSIFVNKDNGATRTSPTLSANDSINIHFCFTYITP